MNILMNIIVLMFEVLYYSMFMYYAKKEGKFWRYILLFSLITIVMLFVGTNMLYAYLIFVLLALYGIKYIVKVKASLYDMFIIVIMLMLKLVIELVVMIILYKLFSFNQFASTIIFDFIKIAFLLCFKNKIYKFSIRFKKLWDNNNFYIRYIFTIGIYIYVIISIISAFWLIVI